MFLKLHNLLVAVVAQGLLDYPQQLAVLVMVAQA
jgi:hypothetical protein